MWEYVCDLQLSRVEREGYYEKERAYLEKMSAMASEMADLKSTNGGKVEMR